jgi:hypothetical protein
MRQFKSTGVQRTDNAQRFPDNNILGILAPDFRLESVGHVGITETLDTLWHGAFEYHMEWKLIVARSDNLSLAFARVFECPGLFIKHLFPP